MGFGFFWQEGGMFVFLLLWRFCLLLFALSESAWGIIKRETGEPLYVGYT